MLLLTLVIPILICLLLQPLSSKNVLQDAERVLLLTAHPDDECLFFAPTLLSLPKEVELYSLCLSTGDANGLGQVRKAELELSLEVLGIQKDRRWVVEHPSLQDNITAVWKAEDISREVEPYVAKHDIDTVAFSILVQHKPQFILLSPQILTFDRQGVSSHPNHISLVYGAAHMLKSNRLQKQLRGFSLITVPLVPKYMGPVAALLAKLDIGFAKVLGMLGLGEVMMPVGVFVSGTREYMMAVKAMMKHRSQLVWFRWLYVAFSRYMWVNEWVEISPQNLGI